MQLKLASRQRKAPGMTLPASRGTYALVLRKDAAAAMQVGRLGYFAFPKGYYIYAGSALGSGGLAARLHHHLAFGGKPRWHIDYLRRHALVVEIWVAEAQTRMECRFADALADLSGSTLVAPGFGASDCNCRAHLYYFKRRPRLATFNRRLHQAAAGIAACRIPTDPVANPQSPIK